MQQNLPTPPNNSQFGQNVNLRHYWHMVLERRWLVLTSFFTILLLTAVYLFRATPIYSATVRIQIDRESGNPLNVREAVSLDTREQDYLQTQYKNIVSRSLIESVVNALKLEKDSRYAKSMDVVQAVANDITVVPIRLSRLVDVRVEHPNPETAAKIANALAKNFIEQNLDQKVNSSFQAMTWLMTQVADAKNKVEKSEADLQAYRQQFNEVSLEEGENIVRQSLLKAQDELSKVRAESAQAQQAATEMERMINDGQAIDTIPAVAQSPVVQEIRKQIDLEVANLAALLKRYRDKYPTVIAARSKIEALQNSLIAECDKQMQTVRNNAALLKKSEEKLAQLVTAETEQQQKLNQLKIKYDILKRDAENNKAIHSNVLVRMKETELMSRMNSNNMRVVDRHQAAPTGQTSHRSKCARWLVCRHGRIACPRVLRQLPRRFHQEPGRYRESPATAIPWLYPEHQNQQCGRARSPGAPAPAIQRGRRFPHHSRHSLTHAEGRQISRRLRHEHNPIGR
jgi:uncharacterized protein involved in exopolysaccharide biosynthesis